MVKNNTEKPGFSYSELLGYLKSAFFLTGVALALFVWFLCPIINAVFLNQGNFYQLLTQPGSHDIFTQSVISTIIIIFSFFGSVLLIRSKQASAALRENENRWQFAIEGSRDGVCDWNIVSNDVYYSRRWKEMLGYQEDEISNTVDGWDTRVHPDVACYMAKDKGRNRIHVHHPEDAEIAQRQGEMQWVERLNHALEEDRFCLYAQTIVPFEDSTDRHYELLIRMVDEEGEIIPPGAFLPAAERYNLISKLDHWVIKHIISLLADNPTFLKQNDFCSINLSGQSITEMDCLNFIITQLNESGVAGERICFEITETAAISNLGMAIKFITTLKGLGCQFALDDSGSGLSSFAYLKNLPVDYLKIDGMFVKNIIDDPIDRAMVKSINEIDQVMGMKTIAEFVENDAIKGVLQEIGIDYAQGFGIDKPQSFDVFLSR